VKFNRILVFLSIIVSVISLLLAGCTASNQSPATNAPVPTVTVTATPTTTKAAEATDKKYNCLSPRGVQLPVDTKPLAKRLTTLEGKHIWLTQAEADAVIMPALFERLKKDYPKTTFDRTTSAARGPQKLTDDQLKTCDAIIQGIAW
jgi:hypothetical protein